MFSDNKSVSTVVTTAMYVTCALMLSFLESLLPPLPVPGAKLGLANLALLLCFCHMGPGWGTISAFVRWLLTGILFGSGTSLLFALSGTCCTVAMLWFLRCIPFGRRLSFLGLSVLSAVAHCLGQLGCAGILYGWGLSVLSMYGGWLLLLGTGCGAFTGMVANLLVRRLKRFFSLPHA